MKNYVWYKLVGKTPQIDETKGGWFRQNRNLAKLATTQISDTVIVTTIFMCLTSSEEKKPCLFETSVRIDNEPETFHRFFTWEEAMEGHKRLVEETKIKICNR